MKYDRLIRAAAAMPWAILPDKMTEVLALLEFKAEGGEMPPHVLAAFEAAAPQSRQANGIAVLPLYGVVAQRMNLMSAMSGGTSTEQFTQKFRQALSNPDVAAIVIDVDSPGGSVFGVAELADEIRSARGQGKPIVAVANSMMASAAYWIGSAADEIVVTPGGVVGSIGVLSMHVDESGANEMKGIKPTIISSGKYKAEGAPEVPLSEEARDYRQAQVDQYYDAFINAVATGRRVTAADVRKGYGEGRVVTARQAVSMGMADRIATLDQTIQRLMSPQSRAAVGRRANAEAGAYLLPASIGQTNEPMTPIDGDYLSTEPFLSPTKRQVERALTGCGCSQSEAKAILAHGWPPEARDVPEAAEPVTDDDPRDVESEPVNDEDAAPSEEANPTTDEAISSPPDIAALMRQIDVMALV